MNMLLNYKDQTAFNFYNVTFYNLVMLLVLSTLLLPTPAISAPVSTPSSGDMELILIDEEETHTLSGLHIESYANIIINGMVATIELEQTFKNPSNQWVEGRYVFPLPDDAAVNAMEIRVGDRRIKATIKEKQQAQAIYNKAKAEGKKTALLEQHRPNLFSQNIANIAPKETITVKLRYIQNVQYKDNQFSLLVPTTLTPRYIPKNIVVDDTHLITPSFTTNVDAENALLNPIGINIELNAGLPLANIDSAYHDVVITKTNAEHTINLAKGQVSMDRDFVLSWKPIASYSPQAAIFSETVAGDDYNLIMLMPPQISNLSPHTSAIKKEIIFIIDTSGSMGGTSIEQAKAGLDFALQNLNTSDTFNIIEFNSTFSTLFDAPRIANGHNLSTGKQFLSRLQASGGTEILPALKAALQQEHNQDYLKQIIFITDGSIGNEPQLFEVIHQELDTARLFTVGIGSAPNHFFMRKAAEYGRGTFTQIGDIGEVSKKMKKLFKKINTPSMYNITIEDTEGRPLEVFPNPIPDLYDGEPVIAAIRKDYETDTLLLKGWSQNKSWEKTMSFNHGRNHTGIANLWARKKIEHLLDKKSLGEKEENIKQEVIDIALTHQLMSPYTSFVAVEEKISRPKNSTLKNNEIPNLLPKGQTLKKVNYPQTATSLWLNAILGSFSILLTLFLYITRLDQRSK